ncbi:XRE family transcriptional regulator [Agrobacterium vitis]|uniref:XRE family transcriptional regulator n=1 Tax=Agrobacterium vitis TaxID=373 RepID=UPI0012E724A1|nr:S24 family peptidase [Agrobacterium vitis]MUZ53059.1 XRE family transcriptional regulator [Agrobacterium vitis]MUZ91278.1 XRE family transcriptional regulator [Agrobacterium vitis]MVA40278.1 XRE family transcriptional regulator [Agrobacterium vitis]
MSGVEVGDNNDLISHLHGVQTAYKKQESQQTNVRIPIFSSAGDKSGMENPVQARIRARLTELGLSENEASVSAGLDRNYLRVMFDRPKAVPRKKTLHQLAEALGCSEAWLRTGKAESAAPETETAQDITTLAFSRSSVGPAPTATTAKDVPVLGSAAGSLVNGSFALRDEVVDYVARPPAMSSAKGLYSLFVEGESMQPQFYPGDIIFINPDRPVRPGDTVIVRSKGEEGREVVSLGILKDRRGGQIVIGKHNYGKPTVSIPSSHIIAVHKVLSINEMFGL